MQSIINTDRQCLVCETPFNLHKHYIFFGEGSKQKSEEYGCWCYLCARHHNMCNSTALFKGELDRKLKRHTQIRFNEVYPELDFTTVFNENYL